MNEGQKIGMVAIIVCAAFAMCTGLYDKSFFGFLFGGLIVLFGSLVLAADGADEAGSAVEDAQELPRSD